ncbi:unnamed protein product, partial [Candidula unifasciata]
RGKLNTADNRDASSTLHNDKKTMIKDSRCPNILSGMNQGQWIKRPLTSQEQIPPSYQRNDGRCGDVSYDQSPQFRHMSFKAICNPKGETPCCYTHKCINVSETDCRCPTCYDERQSIHAEYAQWKPEDDRCMVKNFTSIEACSLLNETTLHFVGDSFIRHVFAAMVVLLTNNPEGALKNTTPRSNHLNTAANISRNASELCISQEKKNYTDVGQSTNMPDPVSSDFPKSHILKAENLDISNSSRVRRKADTGNSSLAITSQTSPRTTVDKKPWPRLLWIGAHAPGLLKSSKFSEQTAAGVQSFNKNVYKVLNDFRVPYLDTFEMTKGIVSFDGTHYGYGINMLKANMLLTYIQHELSSDPDWR